MTHRGVDTAGVWRARGRGFSMGTVAAPGHLVHLTGQVAWDAGESIVSPGDVTAQTAQCSANIEALLAVVGGRLDDPVSVTTYYLDPAHLPAIQRVRTRFLTADPLPASTSVQVASLGHPGFLVELSPVAVVPPDRYRPPS